MGYIKLINIRTFSYHGCLVEEAKIGSNYRVDIELKTNLQKSALTDNLKDTVDYVVINKIVVDEMAIRSKLLETVALRIINSVFEVSSKVIYVKVEVSKLNPPIGGDVEAVTIILEEYR